MSSRAAMCRLGAAAVLLLSVGCGVPDQSRWDRGVAVTDAATGARDAGDGDAVFAVVEVGPVAAAIEARGRVLVLDPTVVVAEVTGRVERRTTAAGGEVAAGDLVVELSDAPDPTDELRIDILELEREIAALDGLADEVTRLDTEIAEAIAAARNGTSTDLTAVVAPSGGVISEYFVSVFDVVRPGDPLFAVGDPVTRAVVLDVPDEMSGPDADVETPAVGSAVSLVDPRSVLGDPVPAAVTAIESGSRPAQTVVIALDASSPFSVGDDVTVRFESTSAAASLRVAAAAVRGSSGAAHVIVEDPSGVWHRVEVRIGARTDQFVQIAEAFPPLAEGDRVVVP